MVENNTQFDILLSGSTSECIEGSSKQGFLNCLGCTATYDQPASTLACVDPTGAVEVFITPQGGPVFQPFFDSGGSTVGTISFPAVTTEGVTTITLVAPFPNPSFVPPPPSFALGNPPVYYDISTTATYDPPVTVCLTYPEGSFLENQQPLMFHYEDGQWKDITVSVDLSARSVCGSTLTLSPFALGYKKAVDPSRIKIKKMTMVNPLVKKESGTWSLKAKASLSSASATSSLLAEIDTGGLKATLTGGMNDTLDEVMFSPGQCSFVRGTGRSTKLACVDPHRAKFSFTEQKGKHNDKYYVIEAKTRYNNLNADPGKGTWLQVDLSLGQAQIQYQGAITGCSVRQNQKNTLRMSCVDRRRSEKN